MKSLIILLVFALWPQGAFSKSINKGSLSAVSLPSLRLPHCGGGSGGGNGPQGPPCMHSCSGCCGCNLGGGNHQYGQVVGSSCVIAHGDCMDGKFPPSGSANTKYDSMGQIIKK
mgnify:CR=1 FL=1|jgi:hypothetical protein